MNHSIFEQREREIRRRTRLRIFSFAAVAALISITSLEAVRHPLGAELATVADSNDVRLEADLETRKLVIRMGDSVVAEYDVAVGRDEKPTPIGDFTIRKIIWNPSWVPPDEDWAKNAKPQPPGAKGNPMKVVKMFFQEPDYYIHGTNMVESLGKAESHGCLRMAPDDAYRVARFVMEHGGEPRGENWFWRVLHFRSETKTVYLGHPVPLTID